MSMMPEYQSLKNVEIPKYFHSLVAFLELVSQHLYTKGNFFINLKKWDVNLKNFP